MSPQLTVQTPLQLPPSEIPSYLEQLWSHEEGGNKGANTFSLLIWQPSWIEQKLIQNGINEGALLVSGGIGKPENIKAGYYVKPTIFGKVKNDMSIAREEIFGPVLSVISYDNEEDAIDIANDTDYGLAAYVSGSDHNKLLDLARQLNAGQVHLNYGSAGSEAPFGGFKQSGNGREKAEWGLEEFIEVKAIMG